MDTSTKSDLTHVMCPPWLSLKSTRALRVRGRKREYGGEGDGDDRHLTTPQWTTLKRNHSQYRVFCVHLYRMKEERPTHVHKATEGSP